MRTDHFYLVLCNSEMSWFGASLSRRGGGTELLASGLMVGLLLACHTTPYLIPDQNSAWRRRVVSASSPEMASGEMPPFLQEDVPVLSGFFFVCLGFF